MVGFFLFVKCLILLQQYVRRQSAIPSLSHAVPDTLWIGSIDEDLPPHVAALTNAGIQASKTQPQNSR